MELLPHEKFKIYRQRKGYSQQKMASLLHCSQMQISRLERGITPKDEFIKFIEKTLGTFIWTRDDVGGKK